MTLLRRIYSFILPYWRTITTAIIASLLYALFNGFTIWMSATFIDTIFSRSVENREPVSLESSRGVEDIQKKFSLNNYLKEKTRALVEQDTKVETLRAVCILVFLAFILKNILGYIKGILITRVNLNTVNNIRNTLYGHLQVVLGLF